MKKRRQIRRRIATHIQGKEALNEEAASVYSKGQHLHPLAAALAAFDHYKIGLAAPRAADILHALELLSVRDCGGAGTLSLKYGDSRYKRQLVAEMQRLCCGAAKAAALGSDDRELLKLTLLWRLPALIKGAESFSSALRDLKFNAYYPALIYSALTGMIEENRKWQK